MMILLCVWFCYEWGDRLLNCLSYSWQSVQQKVFLFEMWITKVTSVLFIPLESVRRCHTKVSWSKQTVINTLLSWIAQRDEKQSIRLLLSQYTCNQLPHLPYLVNGHYGNTLLNMSSHLRLVAWFPWRPVCYTMRGIVGWSSISTIVSVEYIIQHVLLYVCN